MAFCGNCGAAISPSTGFCGACGKPVAQTNPSQPAAAPVTVSGGGWNTVPSQPLAAPANSSQSGWAPVGSQPPQSAGTVPNAGWTQPAQPPVASPLSGPGWTSPPAGASAPTWNSAGPQPAAAAAPAMGVAANTGLTPNIAGALAYSLGIITGVLFLVLEPYRRDRFVRFHAMQSILYFVAAVAFNILWSIVIGFVITLTSGWVAFIAFPIRLLISLGLFGLWLFLMFQAYNQKGFRIPILGAIASKQAG